MFRLIVTAERRCLAVRDILIKDYGIDSSRFVVDPKGKVDLLSDTRKLHPRGIHLVNRRVDLFQFTQ